MSYTNVAAKVYALVVQSPKRHTVIVIGFNVCFVCSINLGYLHQGGGEGGPPCEQEIVADAGRRCRRRSRGRLNIMLGCSRYTMDSTWVLDLAKLTNVKNSISIFPTSFKSKRTCHIKLIWMSETCIGLCIFAASVSDNSTIANFAWYADLMQIPYGPA